MKLLNCLKCHDIVKLADERRRCLCGASAGEYTDDVYALVSGPCRVLGIANHEYAHTLPRNGGKREAKWWTIDENLKDCHVRRDG